MEFNFESPIKISNLNFAYGTRNILKNITMSVEKGQIVGLLGPNGSGKSTILKTVSKILTNYSGIVNIMDSEVSLFSRKELACIIASVPQETTFSFPFSVLEVVIMGRQPYLSGLSFESKYDIEIAEQALEQCGASELATRTIHELSSGERQRVVFARALAQDPSILLLDEPASFLDIKHQVELYDIVRDLARNNGCTVLTVLHDLNLAAEYCDKIYLLSDGEIKAGGTIQETLTYTNLKKVFSTEVYVDINNLTGKPLVVPLSKQAFSYYMQQRDMLPKN